MKRVEIEISDNRKFTQVAMLVDRPDFLEDLIPIRKRLEVENFPYKLGPYQHTEANNVADAYRKGELTISEACEGLDDYCFGNGLSFVELDSTLASAREYAESLANKYLRDRSFIPVILAVLLSNRVVDYDFKSTGVLKLDLSTVKKLEQDLYDDFPPTGRIITISVVRESTLDEVQEVFEHIQKYIFKTVKLGVDNDLLALYNDNASIVEFQDTKSQIRRDREWYWMYEDGLSYHKIWESLDENERGYNWDKVKKAVQKYRKLVVGEV